MQTVTAKFLCSSRMQSKHWYGITEFFQMLMLATAVFGSQAGPRPRLSEREEGITLFAQLRLFLSTYADHLLDDRVPEILNEHHYKPDNVERAKESFLRRYKNDFLRNMLFKTILERFSKKIRETMPKDEEHSTFGTAGTLLCASIDIFVGIAGLQVHNLKQGIHGIAKFLHHSAMVFTGAKEIKETFKGNDKLKSALKTMDLHLMQMENEVHMLGINEELRKEIESLKATAIDGIIKFQLDQVKWINNADSEDNKEFRTLWSELYMKRMSQLCWKNICAPYTSMAMHVKNLKVVSNSLDKKVTSMAMQVKHLKVASDRLEEKVEALEQVSDVLEQYPNSDRLEGKVNALEEESDDSQRSMPDSDPPAFDVPAKVMNGDSLDG